MSGFTSLPPATGPKIVTGTSINPFSTVSFADNLNAVENITVTLALDTNDYYGPSPSSLGTLSDPGGGGTFSAATDAFTAAAVVAGTPTPATAILDRLVYTAPTISNGTGPFVTATVFVNRTDPATGIVTYFATSEILEIVTPPSITGIPVGPQPIASGGTLRPFSNATVIDNNVDHNPDLTETITVTDGGVPTDADGFFNGDGVVSKSGVGTYVLAANSAFDLYNLSFSTTPVANGQTRLTNFTVTATDTATNLSSTTVTSVETFGSPSGPPLIAGTAAGQIVTPGDPISPFAGTTVSDPNPSPSDSATITQTGGGGTLSGAGLTAASGGRYTLGATTPDGLTTELNNLSFAPPLLTPAQKQETTHFKLVVADAGQTATDNTTSVIVQAGSHWTDPLTPSTRMYFLTQPGASGTQDALVDPAYYLASNPDVAAAGVNATQHYETYGWDEGRNPDPLFNTNYYLAQNPDVAAAGVDPMLHYEEYGWKEGRNPSASFSTDKYLTANPDVGAAGIDPLVHFEQYGSHEGRLIWHV